MQQKPTATLIVPDLHAPYHDVRAFELMLTVARDIKPNIVITLGDWCDNYCVSSHLKQPSRPRSLKWELSVAKTCLQALATATPGAKRTFLAGNHEDRLERYIATNAPELDGLTYITDLLDLQKIGYDYVAYRHLHKSNKVYYTHDVGGAGQNALRQARSLLEHNVVIGHVHRSEVLYRGNVLGESRVAATFGWLGDARTIDYMSKPKVAVDWQLGFGIGWVANGLTHLQNVPILVHMDAGKVSYSCVVNGKAYKG